MEEIKQTLKARCPLCGTDFEIEVGKIKAVCPSCEQEVQSSMAVKYYESLNDNGAGVEAKEAHGEDYHKVNMLLDEIYGLIEMEEWERAEDKFNEALDLTETDYRVFMSMVAIKTKNYTDLNDEEHKHFINRAIACADPDQKKQIVQTYKPYYQKKNFTAEELQIYSTEEAKFKKKKLEKGLKNMIPEYMAMEKRNKVFLVLFPIFIVLGIAVVTLSCFIDDLKWMSIVGAVVVIVGYLLFRSWFLNRDKIRAFNGLLDLYDFVDSKDYNETVLGALCTHMQKLCDKFSENAPTVSMGDVTTALIDYVITLSDDGMNKFMLSDKYFSQFVAEGEEDK
ncbi:MAG: hypothetical protein E7360_04155 [Clostridiales bacterium]|nr:hypothetical protein [Clostridiales bacterium]